MRRTVLIPLLGLFLMALAAAPAQAELSVEEFETTTTVSDAGGHPDLRTRFKLKDVGAPEVAKNITFNAPRGLFGNPSALTPCESLSLALQECGANSQVGLITIRANYLGDPNHLMGIAPIYSVETAGDEAARFAFNVPTLNIPIVIPVTVRSASDYGLRFTVSGITGETPVTEADLTFWGFPADASHDSERFAKGSQAEPAGCTKEAIETLGPPGGAFSCLTLYNFLRTNSFEPVKASVANRPFTGNPSVCGQSMVTTLDVETYQRPGLLAHAESSYPQTINCERQTFRPFAQARLTTKTVDSASGMEYEFFIPQSQEKAASPSMLRAVRLVLPEGLTINPDAADGQAACSAAEADFGSEGPGHCPNSSKAGSVKIESESLPGILEGSIYLGEPVPGNQYRLFLFADGFGIHTKLIGKLLPDPRTGRLTVEFDDLPQLPLEKFETHVFASDRGVFATPTQCAVYSVDTHLYPWNPLQPDQNSQFGLSVTEGANGKPCPGIVRPFSPKLNAGTSNSNAGSFSSFTLKLDREDGDQYLKDLGFTMPPGLTGSLRGLTYCPESGIASASEKLGRTELAIPSCPSSSQVGSTNVAAGPGTHPFHAVGSMYLAGPFKGAPLSLVAITPALAGPYDYGTVVVRVAVNVDSLDAHVTALSDTVPSIIGGIPLRIRSIQVNLDKPNFILNPTNCQPMSAGSKGVGDQGTTTEFSSYFQAANCANLGFKPQMSMKYLSGGKARAKNPAMEFRLRTKPGDANIKSVAVVLSKAFAIDQRHLGNICSEAQLVSSKCQGKQPIGHATTNTPLLDQPLSGPVYAVSGGGGLPRLAFVLDGQVPLVPRAKSSSVNKGALKTTVPVVPDAPIGDFKLTLLGGKQGYLINTRSLCNKPVINTIEYVAQSGKKLTQNVKAKTPCGAKSRKRSK